MRYRLGCAAFVIAGLAWLGYFLFEFVATSMGDCADDSACDFYRGYVEGFVVWRGIAVALMLILAFLAFRFLYKEDNVQ
ncbi:hypothetical protein [Sphingomonas alba]|uniref:Transmembrane protein n=1 Tax=Sphingomonas alba TaxID=2908208 RepID=A0ABT0RPY6_9SPHN|nr:hypothetical protein [Sphingomonas alba]MCL6684728.1 hypothetical protein [Sphingomonas alba]